MKKTKQQVTTAYKMAHLRQPAMLHLVRHQVNVEGQRKFLAAQDAQQQMIGRMRLGTLRGTPYLQ